MIGTHFGGGGISPSFGTDGSSIVVRSGSGRGGSGYACSSNSSYQYHLTKPSEEYFLTNCPSENGIQSDHGFARITLTGNSFNSDNYINQSLICIHANYIQYFANLLLIIFSM